MSNYKNTNEDGLPRPVIDRNGRFECPPEWNFHLPSLSNIFKFLVCSKDESGIPSNEILDNSLPVTKLKPDQIREPPPNGMIRVTWLGHATVLVQMDGVCFLTDPIFNERCGPRGLKHLPGVPSRYRPCPCTADDLKDVPVDAVVISHNHFDHLDYSSVCDLNRVFGNKLTWYVPLGLKQWMIDSGVRNVHELSWWKEKASDKNANVKFVSVPAQHYSNRSISDSNKALWCGWCVIGPTCKFYFPGDTGYNEFIFKTIRKQFGRFDLAALPIGAYNPSFIMKPHHISPQEAFTIHKEIEAYNTIGIHWGTFKLTNEPYLEPRDKVQELQQQDAEQSGNLPDKERRGFFTTNPGVSELLSGWPQ
jgi:N-acyl-phosphatidylethanolamine-hydrolysing phospholipase D